MTSAFRVSARDMEPQWSAVHQDIPSNRVIVRNLSPSTREETITIHFQRKRNGGGEVEGVRLLSEGVAVVTFEKSEVADRVLDRRHEIDGALVTLERHQILHTDQVFGKVAGRLDPKSLGVSFSSLEGILQTIHDKTKVEWKEIFDGFVVSGTFEQLETVRKLLMCHLKNTEEHKSERTPKDGRRPLVRDITTTRQSMVGGEVSTGSTSLRTPSICRSEKTIDKPSGRKYNKRSIPSKSLVEGNEGTGNPHSLVENERVRESENAKKLDQPNVISDVSKTRSNRKTRIQDETESQSDGLRRPTPVTPSSKKQFVFLENGTEKTSGNGYHKTGADDASLPSRETESQNDGLSRPAPVTRSSKKQFVFLENSTEKTSGDGHHKTGVDDASPPSWETESQSDGLSRPAPVTLSSKKQFVFLGNSTEKTSGNGHHKTGVDDTSPPSRETDSQSDGLSRPTLVTPSSKKQFVFLGNSTEKTSGNGHHKTGVDDASPPSWVSEMGNTSANGIRSEDQGEDQDHEDAKNLFTSVTMWEMPLESSRGKTDRPTQPNRKLPTGLPDKYISCEDLQSESTKLKRRCDADKTTLIAPVLDEASGQENQSYSHLENPKSDQSLSKGLDEYTTKGNSLKYITSTGITVLLQKGDITSSDVDILLSPVNPTLSCNEGVPKLILEKGGPVIREECHSIAKADCPLQFGTTFITSCGNLPCRGVLHAVLPPWIRGNKNQRAYKHQIHRYLTEGLALASGYRHRSVALPPLGQDGNCIPLEVSVEVITRVIAKFNDNVGPMHTGINDIRVVCEDEATMNAFEKELSSFTFRGENPYFKMTPSKNKLEGEDVIPKYQRAGRTRAKCDEGVDSSIATKKPVEQNQKETSLPEKGFLPKTENAQILPSYPKIKTDASSQLKAQPDSAEIVPVADEEMKDTSLNNSKQCHENTITVISSSCTESIDISEASVFEILEETSATTVALVEEVAKRVTMQDNSGRKLLKEFNLKVEKENFEERNGNVAETGELLEKLLALKITKAMTPEIQQPKPSPFSTTKDQGKEIPVSETGHFQRSLEDTQNLDPFQSRVHETTDAHSSDSSSLRMGNDLFVTSPTVEALLNADLRLGDQGLHIEHERKRTTGKAGDQGKKSVLPLNQKESNSTEHLVSLTTSNKKEMIIETNFQEDINENLHSKMEPAATGTGDKRKSTLDEKCDFKETDGKKEEIDLGHVENYFSGDKRKVSSELPVAFLCALCQDTVDHPDLIDPNVCIQHKFCDDCILKAFIFSNDCPVCVDSYGLIAAEGAYNAERNHTAELDTKDLHPSFADPSFSIDQKGSVYWTAYPHVFKANQPPGQMMWKRYEDSLPGFEGCGTFVVTFTFYDGIQSSEHPTPGEMYKGLSCVAYVPDNLDGKHVLKLLQKAFDARLIFTVSRSASDPQCQVALNGVELKTSAERNAKNGYPDHGYLPRVRKQLAAKGFQ